MTRCGICIRDDCELRCPSCMNHELLPLKLDYIEALRTIDESKPVIDKILHAVNGEQLIREFLKGELVLTGDVQMSVVLNSRLLTVEVILLRYRMGKLRKTVELVKGRVGDMRSRLEKSRMLIRDKKEALSVRKEELKKGGGLRSQGSSCLDELKVDDLRLVKQIDISKSLLFQELISLYIVRKRKVSNRLVFSISFTPLISIFDALEFGKETIDSSLEKSIKFINSVAKTLLVTLPYDIPVKFNYISNHLFDVEMEELESFTELFAKLVHNTVYLLRHLELIHGELSMSQLFKFDQLLYKLCYNEYKIATTDAVAHVSLDELQHMFLQYLSSKRKSKRNEWHVVDIDVE